MAKKPVLTPSEPEVASDEFDIPGTSGATGRGGDRGDYVSIITDRESRYLAVYPRDELMQHMADWRFVTHRFKSNETGVIEAVKLVKGDRGSGIRKGKGSRPHYHLGLTSVAVTDINNGDGSNVGEGIVDGDAVVFTLPPLIRGKYKSFKLSRS
jgi:hypothetical protein